MGHENNPNPDSKPPLWQRALAGGAAGAASVAGSGSPINAAAQISASLLRKKRKGDAEEVPPITTGYPGRTL